MKPVTLVACALACAAIAPAVHAACSVTISTARCVSAFGQAPTGPATEEAGISARFVQAPERPERPERIVPGRSTRFFSTSAVPPPPPTYAPGDVLPDDVMILLNRERHGLPAPRDGWTYFRTGREVYRADLQTREVIDRVNDHMSIRF
ncbi:hypothetical protein GLS40_03620 [Pseudooceanicola sp. 216_PA32_1]|uniref:Nickel/cobalt transporter regulator n=1 Tax=Pseudooceanicola pacificus TaxID=2676438 RepID=A0A844VZA7_9RHOB|nr:hypothetical protein [Pseudooceanicola pacificus]MWB77106.1 hypothetical protein [Pseudooceanicola pacificus]